MNNIMVDIETLGTAPGSVVLSIGAVYFGPEGLGEKFYEVIDKRDSLERGLTTDKSTVDWWAKQSADARKVLIDAVTDDVALPLDEVLKRFSVYVKPGCKVWGNGAGFDNPLIEALYRNVGKPAPWKFWDSRCFRTLKALFPINETVKKVVAHNALQDAIDQAKLAVKILANIKDK